MAITETFLPQKAFRDNIPDYVLSDVSETVTLSIRVDEATIAVNVELIPDANGKVAIRTKNLVHNIASLARPEAVTERLPQLRIMAKAAGWSSTQTVRIIPGGLSSDTGADTSDFLAKNFLTWQPQVIETTRAQPQWLAFVPTGVLVTRNIKSTLYTTDGRSFSKTLLSMSSGDDYCQFRTDYAFLWSEFCAERNIEPYCYDVFGEISRISEVAVPAEGIVEAQPKVVPPAVVTNRPFAQRYVLCPEKISDICFGFQNTLGGFDTLMMTGQIVLKPEGENGFFTNRGVEAELNNDYTSYWEASTGYIDSERMAAQYQDFLKSTGRYVLRDGLWKKIIVDKYNIEHVTRELNVYTFEYHLAERSESRFYDRVELEKPTLPNQYFKD